MVYEDSEYIETDIPYVPGYLAFREAPFCLKLLDKLKKNKPGLYP